MRSQSAAATSKKARPLEEPRRLEAGPSEGHQCLKPWINRHPGQDALLLNEHLSRQLRQARITLSAERQIIQHLPGILLQSGLAGKEGHGWAPRRTPPPAGAGQGPAPYSNAERSAANANNGRLVKPLTRPPIMRRAGAAPHRELVAMRAPQTHLWRALACQPAQ